ncbi:anti-sigma factor [Bacteroidia bacterium]|nr:anti-sigma factor [Bacteroidia bacterium]
MPKVRQIIGAYIKNTHSGSVRKKFAMWLKDERNEKEKEEALMELWNGLNVEAGPSTEESFRKLQSRISGTRRAKPVSFIHKLSRVAAILLLPLLTAMFTYLYMKKDALATEDVKLVEYIVPNGTIKDIVLPDSSQVRLNAGSILVYPQRFGKTRNVYLNGEAYFTVAYNKKHPFIVNTTDMEVEVLGTVFNISSYTGNESSSATLESGKVNVRFKSAGYEPVALTPNERVSFNRNLGLVEKQTIKVEHVIAWTKGNIAIHSMSIEEIAKTIERKYGITVYLSSHKYKNERVTMKLDNEENVAEVMNILQNLIPGLRYKIESEKLYIY